MVGDKSFKTGGQAQGRRIRRNSSKVPGGRTCWIFSICLLAWRFSSFVGHSQKPLSGSKEEIVAYIIAGIIAILLFGYLTYALLHPERF